MEEIIEKLEELIDTYESDGTLGDENEIYKDFKELIDSYYEQEMSKY